MHVLVEAKKQEHRGAQAIVDEAERAYSEQDWVIDDPERLGAVGCGPGCFRTSRKQLVQFQIRALLLANSSEWGTDDHKWMRSMMAGKESVIGSSTTCSAYWSAASIVLQEKELDGRLDNLLIMPCLQELKRGGMAGFRCRAKLIKVRVGDGLYGDGKAVAVTSLDKATEMMSSIRSYLPSAALEEVLSDNTPVKLLFLIAVLPDKRATSDKPEPQGHQRRGKERLAKQALAHGLKFITPELRDYRGLRLADKLQALRAHFELPDDYSNERMASRPWMPDECDTFRKKVDHLYDRIFPPPKQEAAAAKGGRRSLVQRMSTRFSLSGIRRGGGPRASVFGGRRSVVGGHVPVNGILPISAQGGEQVKRRRASLTRAATTAPVKNPPNPPVSLLDDLGKSFVTTNLLSLFGQTTNLDTLDEENEDAKDQAGATRARASTLKPQVADPRGVQGDGTAADALLRAAVMAEQAGAAVEPPAKRASFVEQVEQFSQRLFGNDAASMATWSGGPTILEEPGAPTANVPIAPQPVPATPAHAPHAAPAAQAAQAPRGSPPCLQTWSSAESAGPSVALSDADVEFENAKAAEVAAAEAMKAAQQAAAKAKLALIHAQKAKLLEQEKAAHAAMAERQQALKREEAQALSMLQGVDA